MARLSIYLLTLVLLTTSTACRKQAQPVPAIATAPAAVVPAEQHTPAASHLPSTEEELSAKKEQKSRVDELGDEYTANKKSDPSMRENDKKLEKELRQLRPREVVELDGTEIDLRFTGALIPAAMDAQLCDLTFELEDEKGNVATATMTDKKRSVAATLNLGWCSVKVKPQISKGDVLPIGSGRIASRAQRLGHYEIAILDEKGKLIANAYVNRDRSFAHGAPVPGYTSWMKRDREREDIGLYTIAKVASDKSTTEILMLRWSDSGFERQSATDKVGNIFEYSYPNGTLEVIPVN